MKRAKESKRPESYQPDAFVEARERFATETALRRALENNGLRLFFQPICDLATGRITAFEALTRGGEGLGSPERFIAVAEESGLILPLGRWAIDAALATLAEWDQRGGNHDIAVTVNVSAIQLQRDDIGVVVEESLARHGIEGHRLKLELTESALVQEPERIIVALQALRALGVTIAMDDFGTGYSNLAYLQRLPIDLLKIDRSFVTGMLGDRDKVSIIRAILSLSRALGMQTVAEGIETPELAQALAALGCTFGQGYSFSRPVDGDAAYALLVNRNA
jgi:EAL domain-containing protein (putative c-di-GMP-specific phosphodiesterase class I)